MVDTVINGASEIQRGASREDDVWAYAVETHAGDQQNYGAGEPAFVVRVPDRNYWKTLVQGNAYRVAMAFVRGDFQIEGDLLQAIRWWHTRRHVPHPREWAMWALSRWRWESWFQSAGRARHNIRFHY